MSKLEKNVYVTGNCRNRAFPEMPNSHNCLRQIHRLSVWYNHITTTDDAYLTHVRFGFCDNDDDQVAEGHCPQPGGLNDGLHRGGSLEE